MDNTILGGPMFQPCDGDIWKSTHKKTGAHYNHYECDPENGMEGLREMFPEGEANSLNFVLFSTSGIHGTYSTIEGIEEAEEDEDGYKEEYLTFLIIQPRLCCMRYGNCMPKTEDDFKFLKKLRETSHNVVQDIGV